MVVEEAKTRLRELSGVESALLTPSQKKEIETLYEKVTGEVFKKTSCNDCYKDACIIAYNYLSNHGAFAEKRLYKMVAGACVQVEFGSADFLTAANCTDEKARVYLSKHPEAIDLFFQFPKNWKRDIKTALQSPQTAEEVQVTTTRKRKAQKANNT